MCLELPRFWCGQHLWAVFGIVVRSGSREDLWGSYFSLPWVGPRASATMLKAVPSSPAASPLPSSPLLRAVSGCNHRAL